jgi:antitoxin component YwqK of YwqJK toxin-antitoxin module
VVLGVISSNAQLTEKDGKYYDQNSNLYSGTYVEYYDSGSKKVEMTVVEGVKQGPSTLFFENGKVKEVRSYFNNKMDGTWLTYDTSGVKTGEANYKSGKKHGKWFIWDENGTKRYEMSYNDGAKDSTWTIWDETGKVVGKKKY